MRFMISTVVRAVQLYASGVCNVEMARLPLLSVTSPIIVERPFVLFSSFGPGARNILMIVLRIFFASLLYNNGPITRMAFMELIVILGKAKYVSILGIPVL